MPTLSNRGCTPAFGAGLRRDQIDHLAYACPAAPFHVVASGHVVVAMENLGRAGSANLDFSDLGV